MPHFGIAIGHNNQAGVEDFVPYQPSTPGLQFTKRTKTANDVVDQAPFIRFTFPILDETQLQAALTQGGIYTLPQREVTIHAQDVNYEWVYMNGTLIKPLNEGRRRRHFYNTPFLIIDIFAVTP